VCRDRGGDSRQESFVPKNKCRKKQRTSSSSHETPNKKWAVPFSSQAGSKPTGKNRQASSRSFEKYRCIFLQLRATIDLINEEKMNKKLRFQILLLANPEQF